MALEIISYYMILGRPIIYYLGILTLLSLITTVTLGLLLRRGKIKFKFHKTAAFTTLSLALIHGFLAAAAYF